MRRLILLALLISLTALAQDPSAIGGSQGAQQVFNGFLYANAFGAWSVPQGDGGQFTWNNPNVCNNLNGLSFNLFAVGLPIKIVDVDPTKNEVVTITQENKNSFQCSIVTSALAFTHYSFRITSATLGLQEAINYAKEKNLNTTVVLTNAWTILGGTTAMITAAAGNANIGVLDQRNLVYQAYSWNGSQYQKLGLSGLGINNIDNVPIGSITPSTGIFTSLSSTSGALNGSIGQTTPAAGSFATITGGGGSPLNLPPLGAGSGNDVLQFLQFASATSTYKDLNHAEWYLSRNDSVNNPTCFQGFIGPCDSPLMRVEVSNTQTGRIPGLTGIQIEGDNFAANDNTVVNGNYVSMLDAYVRDAATPNVTLLRASDLVAAYRGVPNKLAGGGFVRSVFPLEIDISNQTSPATDSVLNSASSGNYTGGISIVAIGPATSSVGLTINSSVSTSGKGWIRGIEVSGVSGDCAFCVFKGGTGVFSPSVVQYFAGAGSIGFGCGVGTFTIDADGNSQASPGTCFMAGAIAPTNSGSTAITFRDTNGGGVQSDAQILTDNVNNLDFLFGAPGSEALKLLITPNGVIQFQGSTSGTVNLQAAAVAGSSTAILPAGSSTLAEIGIAQTWTATQTFGAGANINGPAGLLISPTAPTISGHFNTSGDSIAANTTDSFVITVGTGAGTSTGTITLPGAASGWNCWLTNQNRSALIQQTAATSTSATFTNFGTTFTATNWTNSDVLRGGCAAN